jgi:hypothetical protein
MILLVTPSQRASECVAALSEVTGEEIVVAESLVRATTLLRAECYRVVVLDQYLLDTEPDQAAATIAHLDAAILIQVNLALTGSDRLVREVRAAVKRRQREEVSARQAALGNLYCELNDTITALLLSSELALETPGLPPEAAERLLLVHDLVTKLRKQLEISEAAGAFESVARA